MADVWGWGGNVVHSSGARADLAGRPPTGRRRRRPGSHQRWHAEAQRRTDRRTDGLVALSRRPTDQPATRYLYVNASPGAAAGAFCRRRQQITYERTGDATQWPPVVIGRAASADQPDYQPTDRPTDDYRSIPATTAAAPARAPRRRRARRCVRAPTLNAIETPPPPRIQRLRSLQPQHPRTIARPAL